MRSGLVCFTFSEQGHMCTPVNTNIALKVRYYHYYIWIVIWSDCWCYYTTSLV